MKKYTIYESWHNRADNCTCDIFATCDREDNANEIIDSLEVTLKKHGLGKDFPALDEGYKVMSERNGNNISFWLSKNKEGLMSSEYRRIFYIATDEVSDVEVLKDIQDRLNSMCYAKTYEAVNSLPDKTIHFCRARFNELPYVTGYSSNPRNTAYPQVEGLTVTDIRIKDNEMYLTVTDHTGNEWTITHWWVEDNWLQIYQEVMKR